MLGVFLYPAFTRLGHECLDLLSPHDRTHVCTYKTRFMLSSEGVLGNGVRNGVNSKGEKSPLPEAQKRVEPTTLHHEGRRDQYTTD